MKAYKPAQRRGERDTQAEQLHVLQSRAVNDSLEKLRQRYGRYAVPSGELRAVLDKALGERTLTEELDASRAY